jgi:tetratricopeptide (TPR) repeat protein
MRREAALGLLFVAVGLLAAGAAAVLIVTEIRGARAEQRFEDAVERADRLIRAGDLEAAEQAIRRAAANARSEDQWLSTVKRAYRMAHAGADHTVAADIADRGFSAFPNTLDLRAVAAHAAIRAGRFDRAREILSDAPQDERFDSLRAEALVRAGQEPEAGREGPLVLAGLGRDSAPADLRAAYELSGGTTFLLDAVVRYAENGELDRAYDTLSGENAAREHPVLAALLLYDLGDYAAYEDALERMAPSQAVAPEQLMLQADIAMLEGEQRNAAAIYADLRETAPAFSPHQYLNGAWLARSSPERALAILAERGSRFSSDTSVARAEVLLLHGEDPERAREVLQQRRARVREPVVLETLHMHLFERRRGSMVSFVGRLWSLLNRYPDAALPYRYLGWYLVSIGDWEELSVLVERPHPQEALSADLYAGIRAARADDWDEARARFSAVDPRTWHAPFDLGLAYLASGVIDDAHESFESALSLLEPDALSPLTEADRAAARATILTWDSLAYGAAANYERAYSQAARAAELDPDNRRAAYLMTRFAERLP